jgi:hypothetical protein
MIRIPWKIHSYSTGEELNLLLLRNPKVHCRVHDKPPLGPHLNPFNNLTPYFSNVHFDIIFPCPLVYQVISCGFHTKPIYAPITSSVHACCLDYLILPPLICLAMFGEECKLRSSPLSIFLRPSRTASVFSEFSFQRPSIFMFLP